MMPPWRIGNTDQLGAAVLLAVALVAVSTAVKATDVMVEDGSVFNRETFAPGYGTIDVTYLLTSRTVSSTVQFNDCIVIGKHTVTPFANPPDSLATSLYMKWVNPKMSDTGSIGRIVVSSLPPNAYVHSIGGSVAADGRGVIHQFYGAFGTNENVTLRVQDAYLVQPAAQSDYLDSSVLYMDSMPTGHHVTLHISGITVQGVYGILLLFPNGESLSDESFFFVENCRAERTTREPIGIYGAINITKHSAMVFRNITSTEPNRKRFFYCQGDLTVDETSVFSLIDINAAPSFKASTFSLFDVKSIEGQGVIMLVRVAMQKSGLTSLQPVSNANFWVSAKATRSNGDVMTTAQLRAENFNVNDVNTMNWDGTDANGDCVQAGLAVPGRATYAKDAKGNCAATCTDANMTALCTKPYDNPCLVSQCELCYRLSRDLCLRCESHTTLAMPLEDRCECTMQPHCLVCPTKDVCTECEANYKPNEEGICSPCTLPHCLQCPTEDVCTECAEGYKPSEDGTQCFKCDTPLCQQCSADDTCETCEPDYKPANDGKDCYHCVVEHCQECKEDGTCRTCDDTYKPSADDSQCIKCTMPLCELCSADDKCETCETDHKPANDGKDCYHCVVEHCQECKEDGTCRTCDEDFKPSATDGKCYHCTMTNCNYCTSDGECGECADEYKLTTKSQACFHCTMPHCTECSADDMCMQCAEGYKPSADRKSCLQCTESNCAMCGTKNDCQLCDDDHTLTKKGECISCDLPGCLRCDVGGVCAMCNGAQESVSADRTDCVSCSIGNCTYCSDDGKCAMCACGMVPTNDGSSCVACDVANCVHCDLPGDGHTCAECASGYALSDDGDVCERVSMPPWAVFLIVAGVTACIVAAGYASMFLYLRHQAKEGERAADAVERRRNRQDNYYHHRTELFILDIGDIENAASGVRDVHKEICLKTDNDDGTLKKQFP